MQSWQAVVARYKEDIRWARQLNMPIVVYNKGEDETDLEGDFEVIKRPNVGREAETYLNHIVKYYDNLPDFLVLLQGNPFDHCKNLLEVLEDMGEPKSLVPLAENWKREPLMGTYNWEGFQECLLEFAEFLGVSQDSVARYAAGAQYVVPREVILSRPKSFYQELLEKNNKEQHPLIGWAMEKLWPQIFGMPSTSGAEYIHIVEVEEEKERVALKDAIENAVDLVLFKKSSSSFASEALAQLFKQYKFAKPREDDPVLLLPDGSFFTCRATLLQHYVFLEKKGLDLRSLTSRGVRVLMFS